MWFVQLQRVALQLRARSAAQPLQAPPAPLQHHQPGAQLTLVLPTFLWRVKCFTSLMPNHQEEHRGKASPQQIQPELKESGQTKEREGTMRPKTDESNDDIQRLIQRCASGRRRRIWGQCNNGSRSDKGRQTTKDSRRSKPVSAQLFFL